MSWAQVFRKEALPLIDEERFAAMYSADMGRPNRAVQTVLGVLVLKEMFDLTDIAGLFEEINRYLESKGSSYAHLQEGTIVDASIIAAPSSTKNRAVGAKERDPEMHQTEEG